MLAQGQVALCKTIQTNGLHGNTAVKLMNILEVNN